jgi:hypothetical protein
MDHDGIMIIMMEFVRAMEFASFQISKSALSALSGDLYTGGRGPSHLGSSRRNCPEDVRHLQDICKIWQNVAILFPFASIYQTARLWFDKFDMFDMFPRADGDRSRPEADQREHRQVDENRWRMMADVEMNSNDDS